MIAFGMDVAVPAPGYAEHFALVRQINTEAGHIPQDSLDAWQETGPLHVRREFAQHLQQITESGLLHLVSPFPGVTMPSDAEIADIVTSGVHVFLHG
ncbi:hypothetical protein [Amycolatopsis sp.]|uniref:hypothetical protein n=1 Tax=Amycolatopsis sp. TaxID=37632 RepID=UPI0026092335|nr:hypothetical protein [Amycolatopsis sp.]